MDSLQRVETALNFKEPDKIPFDLGSNSNTGIHIKAYRKLKEILGYDDESSVEDIITQKARVEDKIRRELKLDVLGIYPASPCDQEFNIKEGKKYKHIEDEFGIMWRMPQENGLYYDMCRHPLKNANLKAIKEYCFPDAQHHSRFNKFAEIQKKGVKEDLPLLINTIAGGIFELCLWIRGFDDFFMDMAAGAKSAEILLDKALEFKKLYWDKALEYISPEDVVIIGEADDLGSQNSTLISPDMYRKFIKPRHRELLKFIKDRSHEKVFIFLHSCGAIKPLIPDFVDIGFDIINPVQYTASNMDLSKLKQQFGSKIVFWGGGIDTQKVLPYGKPEEVREEIKKNIHILAPDGGFIFAPVHNIQADVPIKNLEVMLKTFKENGEYD